jgi:hypothetical protein
MYLQKTNKQKIMSREKLEEKNILVGVLKVTDGKIRIC